MTVSLAATLFFLGLAGGFFSGWLGIGGGIVMAPLLLYVPAALGTGNLDMKTVAGLTMVQSLFATASGVIVHRRYRFFNRTLVVWMGTGITLASLSGALLSSLLSADFLLGVFTALAIAAAAMMLIPMRDPLSEPPAAEVHFDRGRAVMCSVSIGAAGGLVGQSGAFILMPAMLHILKIPTRTAIGSSLGIVFLAALAGTVGKIATGQVDYPMALFTVAGALFGAQAGGYLSQKTRRKHLRQVLALVIAATAVRMLLDLLGV